MPASPPTRLILSYTTIAGRVIAEITTTTDGQQQISITQWDGARQHGRTVEFPLPRTSRLTALTEAVAKAIAANGD